MSKDFESTSEEDTVIVEKNNNLPELVFDENKTATIVTHLDNTYTVKKISDAAFMNAVSAGGEKNASISMIALVAASLINPVRTRMEVENGFFDGELFFLSNVIGNYYESKSSFLIKQEQQKQ